MKIVWPSRRSISDSLGWWCVTPAQDGWSLFRRSTKLGGRPPTADRRPREPFPARLDYISDRFRGGPGPMPRHRLRWDVFSTICLALHEQGYRYPPTPFGRRVLEFPIRYKAVHSLACAASTYPGALKARFRLHELTSPSTYLRRFQLMAVADLLSDRTVTVAQSRPAGSALSLPESGAG